MVVAIVTLSSGGFRVDDELPFGIELLHDIRWAFCSNRRDGEPSCFDKVVAAVEAMGLAAIPTATTEQLAALREQQR